MACTSEHRLTPYEKIKKGNRIKFTHLTPRFRENEI